MRACGLWLMTAGLAAAAACVDPDCVALSEPVRDAGIDQGIGGLMASAADDCGTFNPCQCTASDGVAFVVAVDVMPADDAAARDAIAAGPVQRVESDGGRWALATPAGPHLVCGEGSRTCAGIVVVAGEVTTVHIIEPNPEPRVLDGDTIILPPTFQVGDAFD